MFAQNCFKLLISKPLIFFSHSILVRDWISLVPPTAAVAGIGYVSYLAFCPQARPQPKAGRSNLTIRQSEAKVVDFVDIEDIAEKAAYCRCWNTKNVSREMYKQWETMIKMCPNIDLSVNQFGNTTQKYTKLTFASISLLQFSVALLRWFPCWPQHKYR